MTFWDNDFDRMFDEAIDELERKENAEEENKNSSSKIQKNT